MAEQPCAKLYKSFQVFLAVVNVVHHGILKGDAPVRTLDVFKKSRFKLAKSIVRNTRHDFIARTLDCRMERHRKGELFRLGAKAVDTREDTAGGKRDVSCPDIQKLFVVKNAQGA